MPLKQPVQESYFKVVSASGTIVRVFTALNLAEAQAECRHRYKPGTIYTIQLATADDYYKWLNSD